MRVCPNCRASLNDFDSVCEYCGTELPKNEEFELVLENARNMLHQANSLLHPTAKIKSAMVKDILEAMSPLIVTVQTNYSESSEAKSVAEKLIFFQRELSEKYEELYKKEHRLKTLKALSIFIAVDFVFLVSCFACIIDEELSVLESFFAFIVWTIIIAVFMRYRFKKSE